MASELILLVEDNEKNRKLAHDVLVHQGYRVADAESGDGKDLDLKVDPATGRVYPDAVASRMNEDDVRAALAAAGYSKVRDVEFDDVEERVTEVAAPSAAAMDVMRMVDS